MTINNDKLFLRNIWDYGFLDGSFGLNPHIKVSDMDGFMGHETLNFLCIEHKLTKDTEIKIGQGMQFERLLRTSLFTIFVIWGKQTDTDIMMQIFYDDGRVSKKKPVTLEMIREQASRWFQAQEQKRNDKRIYDSLAWAERLLRGQD